VAVIFFSMFRPILAVTTGVGSSATNQKDEMQDDRLGSFDDLAFADIDDSLEHTRHMKGAAFRPQDLTNRC
jgi:hypothetical protein